MAGDTAVVAVILSRPVAAATLSRRVEAGTMADPVAVGRPAQVVRDTGTKRAAPNWC